MESALGAGKLPPALLRELLRADAPLPPEVRIGPRLGEDACVIDVPAGALVAATDPITLTGSDVGAHAVVINANDVAVSGVRPRWFLATVLLPLGTRAGDVRALFASMREALAQTGAVLVGGHTEVTAAVAQTVVVGQMLGLAEDGRTLPTGGARAGDAVVQVAPAPLEGGAVLASEWITAADELPEATVARARGAVQDPGLSVVSAALEATRLGATALHDPTESGLSAGLHELAEASDLRLVIDAAAVLWFEPARAVCAAAGADPWGALASGTLLATFEPSRVGAACAALATHGGAAVIGRALPGSGVVFGDGRPLPVFERDEVARVLAARRPTA